jgi:hypothetical protein
MRLSLLLPVVSFALASPACATDAMFFNGGGYCIEVLVGHDGQPSVSQLLFTPPKAKGWIALPAAQVRIDIFDIQKQQFVAHFTNTGNPGLPESFNLSVNKNRGILQISTKRIKGKFDWSM